MAGRRPRSLHPAEQYAVDVLSGKQVACKWVRLAVERQARDLARAADKDPDFPFYFDEFAANRPIEFIQTFCHHSKGKWAKTGEKIRLEPWQQFILWVVFGWKQRDTGLRRFKTVINEVARKNGKSTLLAAIGLYLLIADGEPGAEVYSAATKKDQAKIIWGEASRMVKKSPHLKKKIESSKANLAVLDTSSKFEPLASDEDNLDGLNVHGGLIDEIHAHKTRGVFDVLDTATGSREQPLIWIITTAGTAFPDSIALELLGYGQDILSGVQQDETFFTIIYTLDEDDRWDDEAVWVKANPNLGVSAALDDLQRKCNRAKRTPAAQANFKTKHLDLWQNTHETWLPLEKWEACYEDFTAESLLGRECFVGLDLASTIDIAALVLLFPDAEEVRDRDGNVTDTQEIYRALPFFFVPEENAAAKGEKDRTNYPLWIEQGYIEATDGDVIDYDHIRLRYQNLGESYSIQQGGYDPWNATQITTQLREQDGFDLVPIRQGFGSLSAPSKATEALIASRRIRHNGNPVLKWMFSNVCMKKDPAGNIKPDKSKSADKIDGIVALIMAVDRAVVRAGESSGTILVFG